MTELALNESVFRQRLDEYLWVTQWELMGTYSLNPMMDGGTPFSTELRVCATVKPVGVVRGDSDVAIRHKLLLAYECVVKILEDMGVKWMAYPTLEIGGMVEYRFGGELQLISEARVELRMGVRSE
jgi:hypothetical protein